MEPTTRNVVPWRPAVVPIQPDPVEPDPIEMEDEAYQPVEDEPGLMPSGFIEWFVVAQTAIPAMLYIPGSQAFRLPIRVSAYAITLLAFGIWWFDRGGKRNVRHPAQPWLLLVLLDLVLMIFHPLTNSLLAGVAQTVLYFSIFCAVFWSSAFINRPEQLVRILAIFLVCNGINSLVGVLQVYDPDRWMPRELSFAFARNSDALAAATFVGPGGRVMVRPPGLFDTPGAVCGPGTVAALLGVIFALEQMAWWKRLTAIFFCVRRRLRDLPESRARQPRHPGRHDGDTVLMLGFNGRKTKAVAFGSACAALIVFGLTASTIVGGEGIRDRFLTLLADDPRTIYYQNRGQGLETGFLELADKYPFGAGLARWGMMRTYFGNPANLDSTELFAELQPNAWMLDGGFPLVFLYGMALVVTVAWDWKIVRSVRNPDDQAWVAAIVAANMGTIAMVFSFVPFGTQMGLQFWFLEGALHGAMAHRLKKR